MVRRIGNKSFLHESEESAVTSFFFLMANQNIGHAA